MRLTALVPPGLALGAAALLLSTVPSDGYSLLGFTLDLGQRDFRVFNNFSHPASNDNTTPDPQFPGYTGAVLAIWKASVEWQSELHGTGDGDPHQPGDLGSGGANFDPSFQGEAMGPGGPSDNVHSEISGAGGGVGSFVDVGPDGWRIRYSALVCWDDGPGTTLTPGCLDLQGIATHEYGHAIGLGHSTVGGATMSASISGNGVPARSIANDDINSIQANYGAASAQKPIITASAASAGVATIVGTNFSTTGNEVWFTRLGVGGDGTPVKLLNVPSSAGGTQIQVTIPGNAGPGDVLVMSTGASGDSLSNAFPLDTGPPACSPGTAYCVTAPNSAGSGARIAGLGSASFTLNNLVLACTSCPPDQNGVFYFGDAQTQVPFGEGFRCVAGTLFRLPAVNTGPSGIAFFALDVTVPPVAGTITQGSVWNFQFWFRDPAGGGAFFNLSDALSATFCP